MVATVGVIANPSSGKDIRRLVARGSVFDNNEKVNIVRRALAGLAAVGVRRVLYMPDHFSIVPRAVDGARLELTAEALRVPVEADHRDSTRAARLLAEEGVGCIITLGGDGTNRAVARGCGRVPLVPVSTGTNNVFPAMVEGTLAGLAAGLVATGDLGAPGDAGLAGVIRPSKRLEVLIDGEAADLALVDVASSRERFVGARAIWEPAALRELVLASAEPGSLGLSAIGAHLRPVGRGDPAGLYIRLADPGEPAPGPGAAADATDPGGEQGAGSLVLAPIAPGLVRPVAVRAHRVIAVGEEVALEPGHGTLALDGEREIVLNGRQRVTVRLTQEGPLVVDVPGALALAAARGRFIS